MFKKNTAVTGFPVGHFIGVADGLAVTTGTPGCTRILDGVGAAMVNDAFYNSDAGQWEIDLAAADTNGAMVGLAFTLAGCMPISYRFPTTTKLVSDLNDLAAGALMGLADDAITAAKIAADAIGASELATSAVTEIAAAVSGVDTTASLSEILQHVKRLERLVQQYGCRVNRPK
jgi:hypothetical protein